MLDKVGRFIPGPYSDGIYIGDSRVLADDVPDGSIDMIFTDPEYLKETVYDLYEWLAKVAARVLKPGGFIYTYVGTEFLPDAMTAFAWEDRLKWFWLFPVMHSQGQPRMWSKRIFSGYKPVLAYTKGDVAAADLVWTTSVWRDKKDKRFHKWGQGFGSAVREIEYRTQPEGLILDPFCGGGMTPAAAKFTGRRWLAFDIDPAAVVRARDHLAGIDPSVIQMGIGDYIQTDIFSSEDGGHGQQEPA